MTKRWWSNASISFRRPSRYSPGNLYPIQYAKRLIRLSINRSTPHEVCAPLFAERRTIPSIPMSSPRVPFCRHRRAAAHNTTIGVIRYRAQENDGDDEEEKVKMCTDLQFESSLWRLRAHSAYTRCMNLL